MDANKPESDDQPKRYLKWIFEKNFVTDTGSNLALRLERHVDKKPTQYRWSFGVLVPQHDKTVKFIMGIRPWVDRRDGRVTVKDESAILLMLMQSMQAYITEKEQAAETEWQKQRQSTPRRHDGDKQPKGIKQWGKHDKERREAREREEARASTAMNVTDEPVS